MKRLFISTAIGAMALQGLVFSAPGEAGSAEAPPAPPAPPVPPAPAPAPVQRERQNGFTRPLSGTMTGMVWDIADEISAEKKRPALRDEVWKEYQVRQLGANSATLSTQYSRWCGFHNVQEALRKLRAEQKQAELAANNAEASAKEAEKKAAAEAKAAEKAAKEQAKADKAAAAAKAKADKAAAAEAAKAAKDAATKAAKEEAARKAAEAAAAVPPAPPAQ